MTADWRPPAIGDHAFLSDGQTACLVAADGTVDWLCVPRFDSEACFAALLGTGDNGGWWLGPAAPATSREWRYVDESLVLETLVATDEGEVRITDFMPIERGEAPDIVRIVEGVSGKVEMVSRVAARFDHGRTHPLQRASSDNEVVAIAGPNAIVLRGDAAIVESAQGFESRFTVAKGETKAFILTWFASHHDVPKPVDTEKALDQTRAFWREWSARSNYEGEWAQTVNRSLTVLKGLVHAPTGGIVAAPTASLPERPAGNRNWDYRYCWLRDAAFTLLAFLRTGHDEEAAAWIDWLHRAIGGQPIDVQPFYTIDGGRHSVEQVAEWLPGFQDARPVRFGNGAVGQCQLDVYGEVIDALFIACRSGIGGDGALLVGLLAEKLEAIWRQADAGIWEARGEPRHHVYSKAMCWAAFDRAARLLADSRPTDAKRWRDLAREVRQQVLSRGFDADVGAFTRAYEDKALDAAVLRLAAIGFIEPTDERMVATVAAIERELCHDHYVYRYSSDMTDDGVGGAEGAFLAVGCWMADVLAMQGRMDDARRYFEAIRRAASPLGLLSEEIWLPDRRLVGNFPQALSHLALVNTALTIDSGGKPPRLA